MWSLELEERTPCPHPQCLCIYSQRRLLGPAWLHLGHPEPVIVTRGWGPPVGVMQVTYPPLGWMGVGKSTPVGRGVLLLPTQNETEETNVGTSGQWWDGGCPEDGRITEG